MPLVNIEQTAVSEQADLDFLAQRLGFLMES
jgi:hypothetical protein